MVQLALPNKYPELIGDTTSDSNIFYNSESISIIMEL
jgi:hypothetical protein